MKEAGCKIEGCEPHARQYDDSDRSMGELFRPMLFHSRHRMVKKATQVQKSWERQQDVDIIGSLRQFGYLKQTAPSLRRNSQICCCDTYVAPSPMSIDTLY